MINHKSNKFIIMLAAFMCVGSSFCPDPGTKEEFNGVMDSLYSDFERLELRYPRGGDAFFNLVAQLLGRARNDKREKRISGADFDEFDLFCNSSVLQICDSSSNDSNSAASSSSLRKSVEKLQEELAELRRELDLSFQERSLYADDPSSDSKHQKATKKYQETFHSINEKWSEIEAIQQIDVSNSNYAIAEAKNVESWEMYRQSVEALKKAEELRRSVSESKRTLERLPLASLIEYEIKAYAAAVQFNIEKINKTAFASILTKLSETCAQGDYVVEKFDHVSLEELQELLEGAQKDYDELPKTPSEMKLMQLKIDEQENKAKKLEDEAKRLRNRFRELRQVPDVSLNQQENPADREWTLVNEEKEWSFV